MGADEPMEAAEVAAAPAKAPRVRHFKPGERATLRRPMPAPPKGFTGREHHSLPSLDRVQFFEEARRSA